MVFLTLFAAIITADKTKKQPKVAAMGIDQIENELLIKNPPKRVDPKINKATPKLAPEEIPKTKGPANGFLNKVCINKPAIDNPEPTKMAVIAFGNRNCKTMVCQLSLDTAFPVKVLKISLKGIEIEPKLTFTKNKTTNRVDRNINGFL